MSDERIISPLRNGAPREVLELVDRMERSVEKGLCTREELTRAVGIWTDEGFVLRGNIVSTPQLEEQSTAEKSLALSKEGCTLDLSRREFRDPNGKVTSNLTRVEFDILELLMERSPEIVKRGELLQRTKLGIEASDADNIVNVYLLRLRRKIDPNRPPQLIRTVRGVGVVFRSS